MTLVSRKEQFGRDAANRLGESLAPTVAGARAALETFYYAFNNQLPDLLNEVWSTRGPVQLNNPLGGVLRNPQDIQALYARLLTSEARVWVEFYDIEEWAGPDFVVFAGRERGEYVNRGRTVPLAIRTTRVYRYDDDFGGWRQVHHHGSIDDAALLKDYQGAAATAHS
ncbi:MAG: nuclear transport factor 2 family protein [Candidatus Eisenbacteria bacterium]